MTGNPRKELVESVMDLETALMIESAASDPLVRMVAVTVTEAGSSFKEMSATAAMPPVAVARLVL